MRCLKCRNSGFVEIETTLDYPVAGGPTINVGQVPVLACSACRHERHPGHVVARAELVAMRALFDEGYRTGAALKLARRVLGLRAIDLGDILHVAPETISRWENGHAAIDAATWIAVGALVNDALNESTYTRDRSAALQRTTRVDLKQLAVSYRTPAPCAQHHIGRVVFHSYSGTKAAYSEPPRMDLDRVEYKPLKAA